MFCVAWPSPTILSKAFCVFVRPVLKFSSVIWNPGFKVDIDKIESIQKRFTRACLPHLAYAERLAQLNLLTLETCRLMTDLITCYKLLNSELDVDGYSSIYTSDVTQTTGNSRKLLKHHSASVHDANLFHHRVVNPWNKLPNSVVLAHSMLWHWNGLLCADVPIRNCSLTP